MRHIYADYEEAKRHETGQKRVYRVKLGDKVVYTVSLSPRAAMGEAGPELGITAELVDPRYYLRGTTIEELVEAMGKEQREALLRKLRG